MTIVHVSNGWDFWNGAANIARFIAGEQEALGHHVLLRRWISPRLVRTADELWLHCSWMPCLWWAACVAKACRLLGRGPVVRWMPEGSYDPVRLAYHGWKKRLAGPIERFCLRRADAIVATCDEEAAWVRTYEPHVRQIERTEVRRFFKGLGDASRWTEKAPARDLHVLFLGRNHPLKGTDYLEQAVEKVRAQDGRNIELRLVSNHSGDELERDWSWCDVMALPTLSDNFALVVAEALSRGKRVLVTDGAPAFWAEEPGVTYVRGYRDADPAQRTALLESALTAL